MPFNKGLLELLQSLIFGAPDMGNNLVVKVHYALGSRKH